jgi:D-arabinose 1-dehydrogenase-like Zn-dependent alcohol dehydrogenase
VEMLNFAAKHQVKPVVERFPLSQNGYDAASAKLKNGTMRYRGVLVAEQE